MPSAHIDFDDQTQHGRQVRRFLNATESTYDEGNDLLAVGAQFLSGVGDGSNIAHFDEFVTHYRFGGWTPGSGVTDAQRTQAKAYWDELNSFMAKLNTDAQVTAVKSALLQLIAKLR